LRTCDRVELVQLSGAIQAFKGDVRLSGKYAGEAAEAGSERNPRSDKDRKRDKATVVGRALRTVYDETLREDVPDDFLDLLGKLD
jgi:3'-phosphoadenosine 5'-phosphosulfate sulfotransferase